MNQQYPPHNNYRGNRGGYRGNFHPREEENIEAVVDTSKTFTGMREAEVEGIREMLHLSTPRPSSSNIRHSPTPKTVLHSNSLSLLKMTARISSGLHPKIFRLRIRMNLRRRTMTRRCRLQAGHPHRNRRANKTLQSLALLSKLRQKPRLQPPNLRSHKNLMRHQVARFLR